MPVAVLKKDLALAYWTVEAKLAIEVLAWLIATDVDLWTDFTHFYNSVSSVFSKSDLPTASVDLGSQQMSIFNLSLLA